MLIDVHPSTKNANMRVWKEYVQERERGLCLVCPTIGIDRHTALLCTILGIPLFRSLSAM